MRSPHGKPEPVEGAKPQWRLNANKDQPSLIKKILSICTLSKNAETKIKPPRLGFPIRISAGQRLLAPRHSFSQPVTSFIASMRQGIHQMPFSHLRAPPYPESKTLFKKCRYRPFTPPPPNSDRGSVISDHGKPELVEGAKPLSGA